MLSNSRNRRDRNWDTKWGRCSEVSKQESRGDKNKRKQVQLHGDKSQSPGNPVAANVSEGQHQVYPTLNKAAGGLLKQASRGKTNRILSQLSTLYIGFFRAADVLLHRF